MISAVGLIASEFIVLAVVCGVCIHHYRSPLVTADVTFTVYVCWVFGLAAILLLPYDLSVAFDTDSQNPDMVDLWKAIYWCTFFLAWVVLPIQMEYHNSGHFTFQDKLKDALRRLLLTAVAALIVALIYIVYMVSTSAGSFSQIVGFTMAMGNTYGVLLITVLMGSGLGGLPKRLWQMSNLSAELQRMYLLATPVEDAYQEARYELEDCELEVKAICDLVAQAGPASEVHRNIGEYANILKEKVSNFTFASRSTSRAYGKPHSLAQKDLSSKSELVAVHQRLINAQLRARAAEQRWRHLVSECKIFQNTMNNSQSDEEYSWCLMPIDADQSSLLNACRQSCRSLFIDAHRFWMTTCYNFSLKFAAIVFAFFSVLILWSEMLMSSSLRSPIGFVMSVYSPQTSAIIVQAMAFLVLCYMSICTYWTLFRMNIGWSYRLLAPQLSPPSSLIFNGEYLSRLQFSIAFNFLRILNDKKRTDNASFSSLVQNMQIIPVFGTSFTVYVPIIMSIIAVVTVIDGLPRLLKLMGIETEDSMTSTALCGICRTAGGSGGDVDSDLLEKCNSGQMIIANELRQMELARDALKKNRAAFSTAPQAKLAQQQSQQPQQIYNPMTNTGSTKSSRSTLSQDQSSSATSSSHGIIAKWKDKVVSTMSSLGPTRYSNLDNEQELPKPRSILDEEDDFDEELSGRDQFSLHLNDSQRTNQRVSKVDASIAQKYADRDNDLGESIFTSTLSSNYATGNPERNTSRATKETASRTSAGVPTGYNRHSNPPVVPKTVDRTPANALFQTSKGPAVPREPQPPSKKNFFEFDDEDDDSLTAGNAYRGRYSDV